jgi:hypothetical protein
MNAVIAFILGATLGILACYAWMKGFYKDVGGK